MAGRARLQRATLKTGHGRKQGRHHHVKPGHRKIGKRLALQGAAVDNPVRGGHQSPAGEQLQHVTHVEHIVLGATLRLHPPAILGAHFQPAHRVVGQQGQKVEVFVRVNAPQIVTRGRGRVVEQCHIGQGLVQHGQNESSIQAQRLAQRPQHRVVHPRHLRPIGLHRALHVKVDGGPAVGAVEYGCGTHRVGHAGLPMQLPGLVLVGARPACIGREVAQRHIAPVVVFLHRSIAVQRAWRVKHSPDCPAHARQRLGRYAGAAQHRKASVAQGVVQGVAAGSAGLRASVWGKQAADIDGS